MASLKALPLEILSLIESNLSLYAKLALRRTCRDFYYDLSSGSNLIEALNYDKFDLDRFQLLIEIEKSGKDGSLACSICITRDSPECFDSQNLLVQDPWLRVCSEYVRHRYHFPSTSYKRLLEAHRQGLIKGSVCSACGYAHELKYFDDRVPQESGTAKECLPSTAKVALHPNWIMTFEDFLQLKSNLIDEWVDEYESISPEEALWLGFDWAPSPEARYELDENGQELNPDDSEGFSGILCRIFVEPADKMLLGVNLYWRRYFAFEMLGNHGDRLVIELIQGYAAFKKEKKEITKPKSIEPEILDAWLNPMQFFRLPDDSLQIGLVWNLNLSSIRDKSLIDQPYKFKADAITSEIIARSLDFEICPHVRTTDSRIIDAALCSGIL